MTTSGNPEKSVQKKNTKNGKELKQVQAETPVNAMENKALQMQPMTGQPICSAGKLTYVHN